MKHMYEAHEAHLAHLAHPAHQQYQCWTAPMIFIEKTAHFRRLKKTGYTGTDRPTDGQTDRRTHTHIEMRGRI